MRNRESGAVQSVERALRILDALAAAARPCSLQELSGELGCSPSTVHRLLATLQRFQFVEKDLSSRRYGLGLGVLRLVDAHSRHADVRALALPHLEHLRDRCEETCALYILVDRGHVCAERLESPHGIRRSIQVGASAALAELAATAKALLAWLPPTETDSILATVDWQRVGRSEAAVRADLEAIRGGAAARSFAERVAGVSSLAAAIRDRAGWPCAALSISGPLDRWTAQRMDDVEPELLGAAATVSAGLGYRPRVAAGA
jgi:IclR family acetate operon transcriptional repressor